MAKKATRPSSSSRSAARSAAPTDQRATLIGLGLNKMRRRATLEDTPAVRGMIAKRAAPRPRRRRGVSRIAGERP